MEMENRLEAIRREGGIAKFPEEVVATSAFAGELGTTLQSSAVNEVILFHGTKPETCLQILVDGLNARMSGGLFGNGIYLAEDAGKCDQYCTAHVLGTLPELTRHLHLETGHDQVHYIFVCSALLGHAVHTKDGKRDGDGRAIWQSDEQKELNTIPDSNPPAPFNSLIVDLGGRVIRYREFVMMHNSRIRIDFLLAYVRQ